MLYLRVLFLFATLVSATASGIPMAAQTTPSQWELVGPVAEIGRAGIDLYRVRDAVSLGNGRIAIADAGNGRILLVSEDGGEILGTLGRTGDGPGEFRALSKLAARADTLIAYDIVARRLSSWLLDGTPVATYDVPMQTSDYDGISVSALVSSTDALLTGIRRGEERPARGLYDEMRDVLAFHAPTGEMRRIHTRLWTRVYFQVQSSGAGSGYRTPFLGTTYVLSIEGHLVVVPLDSSFVRIGDRPTESTRVPVPVTRRRFDRSIVDAYRDSLVATMSPEMRRRFPNAERDIRETFGSDFPIPEYAPLFADVRSVGNKVWLQSYTSPGDAFATWYIVDPVAGELVGRVYMPVDWQVLDGRDSATVFILRRDELDIEYVAIYELSVR